MIEVTVDPAYCKGCGICIKMCAKKVFEKTGKRNMAGVSIPEPVHADCCVLCGLCERLCPDGAIDVKPATGA